MSSQLPIPTGSHPDFFPVSFREQALVGFGEQMDKALVELERIHVRPRKNPRLAVEGDRARFSKPK